MRRLVYNPRIDCYIKADTGIYDLGPYITGCQVDRKVNQVSSASVSFRNPNFMFTEHKFKDPISGKTTIGPMFHPQDPIVIALTRLRDHPIQVFTGYCDTTPYLQLFPGVAQIDASCTLKRLMYTYWDPGLPFVWEWLMERGWQINQQVGGIANPTKEAQQLTPGKSDVAKLKDGSFGQLLFDFMIDIGGWPEKSIYIERLPPQIVTLVANLFEQFKDESEQSSREFQQLMTDLLGGNALGGGSPSGAPSGKLTGGSNEEKCFNYYVGQGLSDLASAAIIGNFMQESGCDPKSNQPDGPGMGIAQWSEGGRWNSVINYAKKQHTKPTDLQTQLDFSWLELSGSYRSVLSYLRGANSLSSAVAYVCTNYEIAGSPDMSTRVSYAQAALSKWGGKGH